MPGDTEILHQILAGINQNRGEVARMEDAITEMARSVTDLAKSAVRFEENIESIERRMEDEITRQREAMTGLSQDVRALTESVRVMQQQHRDIEAQVKYLREAKAKEDDNKKWLWRAIIDKLIWPVIAVSATLVALFVGKQG